MTQIEAIQHVISGFVIIGYLLVVAAVVIVWLDARSRKAQH